MQIYGYTQVKELLTTATRVFRLSNAVRMTALSLRL